MKAPIKVLLFSTALLAAAAWATSQPAPAGDSPLLAHATPHDRLFSITFHGRKGIAVGEDGLIMSSTDGGATWGRGKAPTSLALLDVATNGSTTIAVGQQGLVLVRSAEGEWKKVDSGSNQRLLQVDINDAGVAVAVGAFGTLIKSEDSGRSWRSIAPDWAPLYDSGEGDAAVVRDEPTLYVVDVANDGRLLIGGEYGQILRSVDGGAQWQIVHSRPSIDGKSQPTVFGLSIREDGEGYAVGQAGMVVHTLDAGATWSEMPAPSGSSLFAVDSFPDGKVVIVGMRVGIRSSDHGASWKPISGPDLDLNLNWYTGLDHGPAFSSGNSIAVGHSGRVLRLAP